MRCAFYYTTLNKNMQSSSQARIWHITYLLYTTLKASYYLYNAKNLLYYSLKYLHFHHFFTFSENMLFIWLPYVVMSWPCFHSDHVRLHMLTYIHMNYLLPYLNQQQVSMFIQSLNPLHNSASADQLLTFVKLTRLE